MKTMMISNLPVDLLEEILSRIPVKSIGAVRSTCKNWNALSKDQSFANKHIDKAAREKKVLLITGNNKNHLISVQFYDLHNRNFDLSIKGKGILVTRENSDLVVVHGVFYCNGLLLCICGHIKRRLLVWNPYWGTKRWIKNRIERSYEMFAFGYNKSCGTHKIFRLSSDDNIVIHIDIYDLSSDSWKTPDEAFHSNGIEYTKPGLSLKGNTYWYAEDIESGDGFLLCFDFTRERFGPRLPPPVDLRYGPGIYGCSVSLSSVKEEKLALLLKYSFGTEIAVWVTDKIEHDDVLWSKLFKVEMLHLYQGRQFGSFLIDEEKKIVVVFDDYNLSYNTSAYYIIDGESGDIRKMEIIEFPKSRLFNLVGNYVPNSVQF